MSLAIIKGSTASLPSLLAEPRLERLQYGVGRYSHPSFNGSDTVIDGIAHALASIVPRRRRSCYLTNKRVHLDHPALFWCATSLRSLRSGTHVQIRTVSNLPLILMPKPTHWNSWKTSSNTVENFGDSESPCLTTWFFHAHKCLNSSV